MWCKVFTFYNSILFNSCSSTDWSVHAFWLYTKTTEKQNQSKAKQHEESTTEIKKKYKKSAVFFAYPTPRRAYNTHMQRHTSAIVYMNGTYGLWIYGVQQQYTATQPEAPKHSWTHSVSRDHCEQMSFVYVFCCCCFFVLNKKCYFFWMRFSV